MENFFDKFRIDADKKELPEIITHIDNGVVFRGTNLWVLIFAIFVASLGLNLNSTAVIIGAMLISPLMGPIIGVGFGIGINDIALLRKAIINYIIAVLVALATSTLFFLLSPLNEAHSEILARTSPTIYDVLIAFFGGCAGIMATSSRHSGNVLPGVAIATALMPPLCTAGYGLATFQFNYFIGAFYLFIINSVFIAWATFIVVRILHLPTQHLQNKRADRIARVIVMIVVMLTLVPSIYFGYDIVKRDRFTKAANRFIAYESQLPNDYLLNKKIDARAKKITLTYGGKEISPDEIIKMKSTLPRYGLDTGTLEINQGFSYVTETDMIQKSTDENNLTQALAAQDVKLKSLQHYADSLKNITQLSNQVYQEIKAQYPIVNSAVIQPSYQWVDSAAKKNILVVILGVKGTLPSQEKQKLEKWLGIRMGQPDIRLIIE